MKHTELNRDDVLYRENDLLGILIGDTSYGRGEHNRLFREKFNCHRLLLHAWSLELCHPATSKQIRIHAPLDHEFNAVIDAFGWGEALRGL